MTMLLVLMAALTVEEATMSERCRREVLELHQFFEDWFNGELANDEAAFSRFDGVLAADFEIIGPDGRVISRAGIIETLEGAYGSQAEADQPMRIWIDNLEARPLTGGLCLVTYEEWQERSGAVTARLSTAIFSPREGTPNGVQWHHVHETWLSESQLSGG